MVRLPAMILFLTGLRKSLGSSIQPKLHPVIIPHLTLHSQSNMHCASHSWCGVGTLECLPEPALFRMPLSPTGLRDGRWAFVSLFWDPEHRVHTAPPFLPFQAFRARANKWGRGWRVCCVVTWPTKLSVLDPKCP